MIGSIKDHGFNANRPGNLELNIKKLKNLNIIPLSFTESIEKFKKSKIIH